MAKLSPDKRADCQRWEIWESLKRMIFIFTKDDSEDAGVDGDDDAPHHRMKRNKLENAVFCVNKLWKIRVLNIHLL